MCICVSEKRKWGINHKLTAHPTPPPPPALHYKPAPSTLIQSLFGTYPSLMGFQTGFGSGVLGRVNSSLNVDQIQTTVQCTLLKCHLNLTPFRSSSPRCARYKTPAQALTVKRDYQECKTLKRANRITCWSHKQKDQLLLSRET